MGRGAALLHLVDRVSDRLRHDEAFSVTAPDPTAPDFTGMRDSRHALVVTFRRSGEAVPSPLWIALEGTDRLYFRTAADSGKVRRIRNDPRVIVCPSNFRGRPSGPTVAGCAVELDSDHAKRAEAALAAAHGLSRAGFERTVGTWGGPTTYVLVTPAASERPG